MSRLGALCTNANVGIGSKFKAGRWNAREMKRKLNACLKRHGGDPIAKTSMSGSKRIRAWVMWQKVKAGRISEDIMPNIMRDYGQWFKRFEAEAKGA